MICGRYLYEKLWYLIKLYLFVYPGTFMKPPGTLVWIITQNWCKKLSVFMLGKVKNRARWEILLDLKLGWLIAPPPLGPLRVKSYFFVFSFRYKDIPFFREYTQRNFFSGRTTKVLVCVSSLILWFIIILSNINS